MQEPSKTTTRVMILAMNIPVTSTIVISIVFTSVRKVCEYGRLNEENELEVEDDYVY